MPSSHDDRFLELVDSLSKKFLVSGLIIGAALGLISGEGMRPRGEGKFLVNIFVLSVIAMGSVWIFYPLIGGFRENTSISREGLKYGAITLLSFVGSLISLYIALNGFIFNSIFDSSSGLFTFIKTLIPINLVGSILTLIYLKKFNDLSILKINLHFILGIALIIGILPTYAAFSHLQEDIVETDYNPGMFERTLETKVKECIESVEESCIAAFNDTDSLSYRISVPEICSSKGIEELKKQGWDINTDSTISCREGY